MRTPKPPIFVRLFIILLIGWYAAWPGISQSGEPTDTSSQADVASEPGSEAGEEEPEEKRSRREKVDAYRSVQGLENWEYGYDISEYEEGKYNIIIQGTDKAGNTYLEGPYNLVIDPESDLPVASISNPSAGMRVGGDLHIVGTCVDDDAVAAVDVRIGDGEFARAEGTDFWSFDMDVSGLPDGYYTIYARGVDVNGAEGKETEVGFHLDRDKPVIKVGSHANGVLLNGRVELEGTAVDSNGIENLHYSADGRQTWERLRYKYDRDTGEAAFSLRFDTRKMEEGAAVYWFRAADTLGSEGYSAFLFFVDNDAPEVEIVYPAEGDSVNGVFTVCGRILDEVGVDTLTFDDGGEVPAEIELTPGNPFWSREFDFSGRDRADVVFTAVDLTGNSTELKWRYELDSVADLPVVHIPDPAEGEYFADGYFRGYLTDDDGVQSLIYSLDRGEEVAVPCGETFVVELGELSSGEHRIDVRGVDIHGVEGEVTTVEFLKRGTAPKVEFVAVAKEAEEQSYSYYPGIEVEPFSGYRLTGRVEFANPPAEAFVTFPGGQEQPLNLDRGVDDTERHFTIPIDGDIPFGLTEILVRATDEYGEEGRAAGHLYVVNVSRRNEEHGLHFVDTRLGGTLSVFDASGEGSGAVVKVTPRQPLVGLYTGYPVKEYELDPETDVVSLEISGGVVKLSAEKTGNSGPVRIRVVDEVGTEFLSPELTFEADTGPEGEIGSWPPVCFLDRSEASGGEEGIIQEYFNPGDTLPIVSGGVLLGRILGGPEKLAATFSVDGGEQKKVKIDGDAESGERQLSMQLGSDLSYGRHTLEFRLQAPETGESLEKSCFFYKIMPAGKRPVRDDEGLFLLPPADSGLSGPTSGTSSAAATGSSTGDASLRLEPGGTVDFYFNGRETTGYTLEPDNGSFDVAVDGSKVTLTALRSGVFEGVRLTVRTVDSLDFSSPTIDVVVDEGAPEVTITGPEPAGWVGTEFLLTGSVGDDLGIASLAYILGRDGILDPTADGIPVELQESDEFSVSIDASGLGDGYLPLAVKAVDLAGNTTVTKISRMLDTTEPRVRLLTPGAGTKVNGFTGINGLIEDAGRIAGVEYSPDGENYVPIEAGVVFSHGLDLAALETSPDSVRYRVIDLGGNTSIFDPSLRVEAAADEPRIEIQIPEDGAVMRGDFIISGMAFDDDGVADIYYRIDEGEYQSIGGGNNFEIPISLEAITDNEHVVEVVARDLGGTESPVASSTFIISKEEPESRLLSPSLETTERGMVTLVGESSDANGIAEVFISLDNGTTFNRTGGAEQWRYTFDSRLIPDGTNSILIKSVDNTGTDGLHTTLLNIDNTEPVIELSGPLDGDILTDSLVLTGRARDTIDLSELSFTITPATGFAPPGTIPNLRVATPSEAPNADPIEGPLPVQGVFQETVDLSDLPTGWYNLRIRAGDKADNTVYVSRNIYKSERKAVDRIALLFPNPGAVIAGDFSIQGEIQAEELPASVAIYDDERKVAETEVSQFGYFSVDIEPGMFADGSHMLIAKTTLPTGIELESEPTVIDYSFNGPWVTIDNFAAGDFAAARPWLEGSAGYGWTAPSDMDEKAIVRIEKTRRVDRIEVSLDNGKTFEEARGDEEWKYRLETQDIPDGPVPIVVRSYFRDGAIAVAKTQVIVDDDPPDVALIGPEEGAKFNESIPLTGTAFDENGMLDVEVALRKGDKRRYSVPEFVQGLYIDLHALGPTFFDVGVGLSFFDDNVNLQVQAGYAPTGRFSGLVIGMKLLANVVSIPFGFFFGPDADFFSMSLAIGADFSYFTMSEDKIEFTDEGLVLGAIVAQLVFARFDIFPWRVFNAYSLYAEGQFWFISSDIQGGVSPKLTFGVRVEIF